MADKMKKLPVNKIDFLRVSDLKKAQEEEDFTAAENKEIQDILDFFYILNDVSRCIASVIYNYQINGAGQIDLLQETLYNYLANVFAPDNFLEMGSKRKRKKAMQDILQDLNNALGDNFTIGLVPRDDTPRENN